MQRLIEFETALNFLKEKVSIQDMDHYGYVNIVLPITDAHWLQHFTYHPIQSNVGIMNDIKFNDGNINLRIHVGTFIQYYLSRNEGISRRYAAVPETSFVPQTVSHDTQTTNFNRAYNAPNTNINNKNTIPYSYQSNTHLVDSRPVPFGISPIPVNLEMVPNYGYQSYFPQFQQIPVYPQVNDANTNYPGSYYNTGFTTQIQSNNNFAHQITTSNNAPIFPESMSYGNNGFREISLIQTPLQTSINHPQTIETSFISPSNGSNVNRYPPESIEKTRRTLGDLNNQSDLRENFSSIATAPIIPSYVGEVTSAATSYSYPFYEGEQSYPTIQTTLPTPETESRTRENVINEETVDNTHELNPSSRDPLVNSNNNKTQTTLNNEYKSKDSEEDEFTEPEKLKKAIKFLRKRIDAKKFYTPNPAKDAEIKIQVPKEKEEFLDILSRNSKSIEYWECAKSFLCTINMPIFKKYEEKFKNNKKRKRNIDDSENTDNNNLSNFDKSKKYLKKVIKSFRKKINKKLKESKESQQDKININFTNHNIAKLRALLKSQSSLKSSLGITFIKGHSYNRNQITINLPAFEEFEKQQNAVDQHSTKTFATENNQLNTEPSTRVPASEILSVNEIPIYAPPKDYPFANEPELSSFEGSLIYHFHDGVGSKHYDSLENDEFRENLEIGRQQL